MTNKDFKYIGKRVIREDSADKVRGAYDYLADSLPQDTLVGVPLLSEQPNAIIKNIDISEAERMEGVIVLTFRDAPDNKYNSGEWFPGQNDFPDETILTGHARHVGDRIGLVLADDEDRARAALRMIKVEYEALPPVVDMREAQEKAALLHEDGESSFTGRLGYGDADAAFAAAAYVESDEIYTPKIPRAAAPGERHRGAYSVPDNIRRSARGGAGAAAAALKDPRHQGQHGRHLRRQAGVGL